MQRFFGLSGWPASIYLQRELAKISQITDVPTNARDIVEKFFSSTFPVTTFLSVILVLPCFGYYILDSIPTLALSLNIVFIQLGCLIAAVFSLAPQILSIYSKGKSLALSLILATVVSFSAALFSPIEISIALGFLIFHAIFCMLNMHYVRRL